MCPMGVYSPDYHWMKLSRKLHVCEDPILVDTQDRTTTPVEDLCSLIQLCLEVTCFQFGVHVYRQVQGEAMGFLFPNSGARMLACRWVAKSIAAIIGRR